MRPFGGGGRDDPDGPDAPDGTDAPDGMESGESPRIIRFPGRQEAWVSRRRSRTQGLPDPHPRWYALRTRARAERQVAIRLEQRGIRVISGLATVERTWSDRVKRVEMPLFPGYVFACFAVAMASVPLSVPGVADIVGVGRRPTALRDDELEAVIRLMAGVTATGQLPEPVEEDDHLAPGMAVEVTSGPFKGLSGIFLEREGGSRIVVTIDAIKEVRTIRMERDMVRPRGLGLVR
jgi:transcription antitermination factor NusG